MTDPKPPQAELERGQQTDDSPVRVTRRHVLAGVTSLGLVGAGSTVGGTMAWFSDNESSTANTIESGVLELSFGSPSSLDLTKDLTPGSSVSSSVELVNSGTVTTGSVDVDVSYFNGSGGASADDVARELEVTSLTYGPSNVLTQLTDHNQNGIVDLMDFATNDQGAGESTANDLIDLADPGAGRTFGIELTLQNGTNSLDGNSIDVQFTFYLNQTEGQ